MIIIILLKQSHDYLINQVTKIKSIIIFRRELKVYMETKQKTGYTQYFVFAPWPLASAFST